MAERPRFVVADGHIDSKAAISEAYVFQFSSRMVFCGNDVAKSASSPPSFTNNVKCRKWTDLSGRTFNTPCRAAHEPPQPDRGSIVNVGQVTLLIEKNSEP